MRILGFSRRALMSCAAAAALAGCVTTASPYGGAEAPPGAKVQARTASTASRPVPQRQALLYLMTDANFAYVADYPSGKSLHKVSFGGDANATGICSDASGHVFMTAEIKEGNYFTGYIYEFAHDGISPIATLEESGYTPTGCSVDPTTGDLAVTNTFDGNCQGSVVAIYPDAEGTPTTYDVMGFQCLTGAAYDDQGDLFVGGSGGGSNPPPYEIAELRPGSSDFTSITLSKEITCATLECGAPVQWNESYLTITKPTADHVSPTVYRVQVSGSAGTVVGTTTFHDHFNRFSGTGSWVQGNKIILTYRANNVALWPYPAGGKVLNTLKGFKGFAHPGLTISQ
jgi:hypothetical protein